MDAQAFHFEPAELPPAAQALRAEVRAFLREEADAGHWEPAGDFCTHFAPDFSRRVGAKGWIGLTWPKEYGGHARSALERYVVTEEMLVAGAPVTAHWIADRQSGPLLLRFGTEEQRRRYLPGIVRGETYFAIGMSEPDAGSDLASVRTRAERVDGGWKLNGRKVWTTYAHRCHYAITLARSAPQTEKRHEGLTQFILDLKAPGLAINPIINLAGAHEFNEMVFDDVFIADADVVGTPGGGWHQVTSELAFERSGPERFLSSFRLLDGLARAARGSSDTRVLAAIGRFAAHTATLRQMSLSVAAMLARGASPNLEAALIKDLGGAIEREVPETARLLMDALPDHGAALAHVLQESVLYAPSWTLRGGTREILRGIIARGLGLR
jgi:alkylation response protein AidB-like acyl-CoA dehydrogenase